MGDFSIVTDYGSSLQVTISGSRLEVLGFSYGRRVAITEEFGKITISLDSDSIFIGSAEQVTEQATGSPAEIVYTEEDSDLLKYFIELYRNKKEIGKLYNIQADFFI